MGGSAHRGLDLPTLIMNSENTSKVFPTGQSDGGNFSIEKCQSQENNLKELHRELREPPNSGLEPHIPTSLLPFLLSIIAHARFEWLELGEGSLQNNSFKKLSSLDLLVSPSSAVSSECMFCEERAMTTFSSCVPQVLNTDWNNLW